MKKIKTVLGNLLWVLFGLGACAGQQPAVVVEKAQVQAHADTCDDVALEIIRTGETCEAIVRSLNDLVKRRADCRDVFKVKDPVLTCQAVGVQPRRAGQ